MNSIVLSIAVLTVTLLLPSVQCLGSFASEAPLTPIPLASSSTTSTAPATVSSVPLPTSSSIPATPPPSPVAVFVLVLSPNVTVDILKQRLNATLRIPLEAIVVINSAVVVINTPEQTPQPPSSANVSTPQPSSSANSTNTTKSRRFDALGVQSVVQANITFSGARAQEYASSMSSATNATLTSIGISRMVVTSAVSNVPSPIATATPAPQPPVSHATLVLSVALAVSGVIVAALFTVALVYYSKHQYQKEMAEKSDKDKKLLSVPVREQPRSPQKHQNHLDDELLLL